MDKRYQVFVSSTYADLKEERRAVIQTIIELNCIPAGMELFPAADEEQLAFIKRVIDDCDYYLLIIGGRYGSVNESGISYTEQEYDYAIGKGLKVIALLHENPDDIPLGKSEKEPIAREKLQKFRERVSKGRLVKFWKTAADLPGLVSVNLSHAMNAYPAVGWVRADRPANVQVLNEINEVRKENSELQKLVTTYKKKLNDLAPVPPVKDLAGLDEKTTLNGKYYDTYYNRNHRHWRVETTWQEIFGYISPYLVKHPNEDVVKSVLAEALFNTTTERGVVEGLDDQDFQTVGVQLKALGLVSIDYSQTTSGGMALFWSLTGAGERLMVELRTVRSQKPKTKTAS
jgi:hypothetical protein